MDSTERDQLLTWRRRATAAMVGVLVVVLGVLGVMAWFTVGEADHRQHVLGNSTKVEAQVVGVERNGRCRSNPKWRVTIEWNQDGRQRTEDMKRCGDSPEQVGETVTAFATDDDAFWDAPVFMRAGMGVLALMFVALLVYAMHRLRHLRRSADRLLSGAPPAAQWQTLGREGKRLVLLTPSGPMRFTAHASTAIPVGDRARPALPSGAPPGGVLVSTGLRRGKPWGLLLHIGNDGSRRWWFR